MISVIVYPGPDSQSSLYTSSRSAGFILGAVGEETGDPVLALPFLCYFRKGPYRLCT